MPRAGTCSEAQRLRYQANRRALPHFHRAAMLHNAKARARKAGVPFDLTLDDIAVPEVCPVLGIPLVHAVGTHQTANSPTVDRIIPSLGYVKDNIAVMSLKANRIKSDATLTELEAVTEFLRKHSHALPETQED